MRLSRTIIGVSAAATVWSLTLSSALAATNTNAVQPYQSGLTADNTKWGPMEPSLTSTPKAVSHRSHEHRPPKTTTQRASSASAENLYWMEHVINAEAGGESLTAQISVGDVVLHRLQSGQHGGTVRDVVFEETGGCYQFSCVPNGAIYKTPNASSVQAAKDVLQHGEDEVPHAMVFYNPSETSSDNWVRSQTRIIQYDHLVFAK
ncbi:cell wall hydrolase [Alicyclobacillus fastidiosus]|uniref:Cell wall hydrolase n=1 Tax=Alicyclobacillus fastidiosus TaxID=392011 RepID=A0ABY6ZKC4_9BACL|nr:cell wall hydrolase [Alicyclobacillus fastidiosus]WAH43306.1 cell wall hydrolase [Alicyclobacillus fastidiosus]GMA65359.1 hypothetical protein GCM10025859_57990 [Alicyclobacillus fastidiosus]